MQLYVSGTNASRKKVFYFCINISVASEYFLGIVRVFNWEPIYIIKAVKYFVWSNPLVICVLRIRASSLCNYADDVS